MDLTMFEGLRTAVQFSSGSVYHYSPPHPFAHPCMSSSPQSYLWTPTTTIVFLSLSSVRPRAAVCLSPLPFYPSDTGTVYYKPMPTSYAAAPTLTP